MASLTIQGGFPPIKFPEGHFRESTQKKGKNILEAGHVGEVEEVRSGSITRIHGRVTHSVSVREAPYSLEFELDKERSVVNARCSCQAGVTGNCKHSAALLLFINTERSTGCTDDQQAWNKPSKKLRLLYPKGETVEKMYKLKPQPALSFKTDSASLNELAQQLSSCGLTKSSIYKSLTCDKHTVDDVDSTLEEQPALGQDLCQLFDKDQGFPLEEYSLTEEQQQLFVSKVQVDVSTAKEICRRTVGQSKKREWYIQRKLRISASRAHKIWRAREEKTLISYFRDTLIDNVDLKYGRRMEVIARKKYENITEYSVTEVGLVVKESHPWLSASPDGVVKKSNGELIVLEIKCPSTCRDKNISVPYLKNGELSRNHMYFTQIQVQMFCCNVNLAHFFVFSEADYVLLEIQRDDAFL